MSNFFYKNRHKIIFVLFLFFLLLTLTSCRMDSGSWYKKPYTTYSQEWIDLWNNGRGFWNTLWGWPINILSFPIAWLCSTIGKGLGNSFFWGIFFTTLIVRTIAWPIYGKQNGMSLKMTLMQPEIANIQRKYGSRQDPQARQAMQMEMMKVYKKYKVSPLGCIGTMFLQFPIFMSMYEVVQRVNATITTNIDGAVSVTYSGRFALTNTKLFNFFELNTSFLEATELKDKIFAAVIALAFGGLQILQQKLSSRPAKYQKHRPNAQSNQQQQQQKQMKWVMMIMNVMFVIMALSSTSLALYWLIGAIYQIFQSQVGRKINEIQYYKLQKEKNL